MCSGHWHGRRMSERNDTRGYEPDIEVVDYLYGEMTPERRAAFERRLQDEPELRAEVARFQALKTRLDGLPEMEPPPELVDRVIAQAHEACRRREQAEPGWLDRLAESVRWLLRPQAGIALAAMLVVAVGIYMAREAKQPGKPGTPEQAREEMRPLPSKSAPEPEEGAKMALETEQQVPAGAVAETGKEEKSEARTSALAEDGAAPSAASASPGQAEGSPAGPAAEAAAEAPAGTASGGVAGAPASTEAGATGAAGEPAFKSAAAAAPGYKEESGTAGVESDGRAEDLRSRTIEAGNGIAGGGDTARSDVAADSLRGMELEPRGKNLERDNAGPKAEKESAEVRADLSTAGAPAEGAKGAATGGAGPALDKRAGSDAGGLVKTQDASALGGETGYRSPGEKKRKESLEDGKKDSKSWGGDVAESAKLDGDDSTLDRSGEAAGKPTAAPAMPVEAAAPEKPAEVAAPVLVENRYEEPTKKTASKDAPAPVQAARIVTTEDAVPQREVTEERAQEAQEVVQSKKEGGLISLLFGQTDEGRADEAAARESARAKKDAEARAAEEEAARKKAEAAVAEEKMASGKGEEQPGYMEAAKTVDAEEADQALAAEDKKSEAKAVAKAEAKAQEKAPAVAVAKPAEVDCAATWDKLLALEKSGKNAEALALLDEFRTGACAGYVSSDAIGFKEADLLLASGQKDRARKVLNRLKIDSPPAEKKAMDMLDSIEMK